MTGFSAETAGLPVIKLQRVGPRKTSCPDSVAIIFNSHCRRSGTRESKHDGRNETNDDQEYLPILPLNLSLVLETPKAKEAMGSWVDVT